MDEPQKKRVYLTGGCPSGSKPVAVDLFSGAGGLSLGLQWAGLNVRTAVEWDADSRLTYEALHPGAEVWGDDVRTLDFSPLAGLVDVVAGGPPCQPFSIGGKRLASRDPRDMTVEFVRAVGEIRPRAFLMENVPGLADRAHAGQFRGLITSLEALGYSVSWRVLNAADFGVPQSRNRLFVVGTWAGSFDFPSPTHGPGRGKPWVAAGEYLRLDTVIGDPNPSAVVYARRPDLRPQSYHGHLFNGGGRPIDMTRPAPTILASAGGNKTHWLDTEGVVPSYHSHLVQGGTPRSGAVPGARRLTVEESALLQTFPEGTIFAGSRSSRYQQVGNAVPPMLAEVLGLSLLRSLAPQHQPLVAQHGDILRDERRVALLLQ